MKTKTAKQTTVLLAITLAFFLGRESKGGNTYYPRASGYNTIQQQNTHFLEAKKNLSYNRTQVLRLQENNTDTVYRCGKSKIYHPTLLHGSFKICRSKVTKLTIEDAKSKGMRHCKCSGNVLD